MGCPKCGFTGIAYEYDQTAGGDVEVPCPECHGVDDAEPDWVTEGHGVATQAEIDAAWRQHDLDKAVQVC